MERVYLIRYGLGRVVGRFRSDAEAFDRGQTVVIRTHRGTELGEVLAESPPAADREAGLAPILRLALPGDLERSRIAGLERATHYEACRAVFEEGAWPLEIIDAEPLLDPGRTVLHYLGPHQLDASGIVAAFRTRFHLDVVLESVGRDAPEPEPEPEPEAHGCGSCSSSGGCGSSGCESGSKGCSVKAIIAARRRVPVDA